jgi:hypothetical protein
MNFKQLFPQQAYPVSNSRRSYAGDCPLFGGAGEDGVKTRGVIIHPAFSGDTCKSPFLDKLSIEFFKERNIILVS